MLTTTVMATKAPVLIAPAMNTNMYENPIVKHNIETLEAYGYNFIDTEIGRLACGDTGSGKLASVDRILFEIERLLYDKKDLVGKRVLVTAGGTEEPIDGVRCITNRSSGKMGLEIAREARLRGADVAPKSTISIGRLPGLPSNIFWVAAFFGRPAPGLLPPLAIFPPF